MIQVDELAFSGGTIFCAFSTQETYPANGGLRVMQYPSHRAAKEEAIGLASKMILKHRNYHTGFSGGKIVAAVKNLEAPTMLQLIEEVSCYLNSRKGRFLTGCDLNFGDREIEQLFQRSEHVLAALNSDVHYADATASGVIGAVWACLEQLELPDARVIVHGCGAVGSRCAQKLASDLEVSTYDLISEKAELPNCHNISALTNWWEQDCDLLIMVSASRILTLDQLKAFRGKAIVCGANIPFADAAAEQYAREHYLLIDEGIASAGAVIADSIEYYAKDKWKTTHPTTIYQFIQNQVFNLALGIKNDVLTKRTNFIGQLV